jgi:ribosomal protein L13E
MRGRTNFMTKPVVFKKNKKQRYGKGFSRNELKEAGLTFKKALKIKIPIDLRRSTAHKENIHAIKQILKTSFAKKKK